MGCGWFISQLGLAAPGDDPLLWPVLAATAVVTGLCVLLHFEALSLIIGLLRRASLSARKGIMLVIFALLTVHLLEIGLYAATHHALAAAFGERIGTLQGTFDGSLVDTFYFSIAVYTTVGFGDITPDGSLRVLTGVEALTGLVLITWSASFTFVAMQRYWRDRLGILYDAEDDRGDRGADIEGADRRAEGDEPG